VKAPALNRRGFLRRGLSAAALAWGVPPRAAGPAQAQAAAGLHGTRDLNPEELTIADLQRAFQAGQHTARSIAELYLNRIRELDKRGPELRAVVEVNPDALAIASALDAERKTRGPRGPLHGVPVLLKDNLDTADRMGTTAGSLALVGVQRLQDAPVAARLRQAGAVLLGKTNLSEWANFRSSRSSSGWSARGGQTRNPYALDRNPSGSSSGSAVAVAANLTCAAIGTETDGSILSPSSANSIVGIKPTLGLVSQAGIIPIAHSQDTAGPMARTVRDAAILLSAIAEDPAPAGPSTNGPRGARVDFTQFLDPRGLRGARLGVARRFFGFHERVDRLITRAMDEMKRLGAEIIDPADLPSLAQLGNAEMEVLLHEFKADLNRYLAALGPATPVRSLTELIAFNERHRALELPYFGQELFLQAETKGSLGSRRYQEALARCRRVTRTEGIDAVMDKHRLDAFIAPTEGPAWPIDLVGGDHNVGGCPTPAAVAGYPHITAPAGYVYGLPVGLSFFGRARSEPILLKLAYAFEQATRARRSPRFAPTADLAG
jgi:amidase